MISLQSPSTGGTGVSLTNLMVWLLAGGLLALFLVIALLSRARAFRRIDRPVRPDSKIDPWQEAANRLRVSRDRDSNS